MVLSLFKKKNKEEANKAAGSNKSHVLTIKDIIRETEDAITIVFDNPGKRIQYKAGQYLTLILEVDNEEVRRSYSLCSSPVEDKDLAVTVKKLDGGRVSQYIHHELREGDQVKVLEPMGNFTTEFNKDNKRTFLLFAGGSGITPLMSIVKTALLEERESTIILIYQNRNLHSIIYREEIEILQQQYPDRLKVFHVLSKPEKPWKGRAGRLTSAMVRQIIEEENIPLEESDVFFCGPQGMMQTAEKVIDSLGVQRNRRFRESFVASSKKEDSKTAVDQKEMKASEVTIMLDGEEHKITVGPDEFILENALDADIDMPFSCQSGLCTTCRGKLMTGKVSMEEPDGLSEDEIAEGYVLTCVSHPASEKIKIEIG